MLLSSSRCGWKFFTIFTQQSASKKQFDDETIRSSLHLEVHNLKQGQNELLVFLDGVKPDIRFEVCKYAPRTYAEAKSLACNLEAAINEKLCKTVALAVAVVGDASLVGSMEHQLSDLQTQIDALKRSLARFQSNNFRSRNFRTSFSRNTSSPRTSKPGYSAQTIFHMKPCLLQVQTKGLLPVDVV